MKKSFSLCLFTGILLFLLPHWVFGSPSLLTQRGDTLTDTLDIRRPSIPKEFDALGVPDSWTQKYPQELLQLSLSSRTTSKPVSLLSWEEALQETNQAMVLIGESFPKDSLLENRKFIPFASEGKWLFLKAEDDSVQRVHYFYQGGGPFQASDFIEQMGWEIPGKTISREAFDYEWKKSYTFSELDIPTFSLGEGNTLFNKTLPTYLTKGFYKNWKVSLQFNVSNPDGTEAYLNFLANNNLIRSFQVKEEGKYSVEFTIPAIPLSVGSYLSLELIQGNERASLSSVAVEIESENSLISPSFRNEFPMTFSSFPKNMEGKPIRILQDYDLSPSELGALADLILLINDRPNKSYPFYLPEIIRLEKPGAIFDTEDNLILITQTPQAYASLVEGQSKLRYTEQGREYQSDELSRFFQRHENVPLSSMELLDLRGQKMLFIVNDPLGGDAMKEAVDGLEDEFISNTGNILLADAKHYYFFDIRLKEPLGLSVGKKDQFEQFWMGYRIYITLLLLAGLFLLLRYIYIKSQHAKKSIEDART
ncbi:MAG: hypothetical protein EP311_03790 [Cytophagales bacterium]|nr:MAG: hypothetical protein EP311_03790 [Cytophagales bacterium]